MPRAAWAFGRPSAGLLPETRQPSGWQERCEHFQSVPASTIGAKVPVVVFEHVSLAFDDDVVLRDVSFSVPAGHMTIVIGASGAGKSVVRKLILGLLKPDAGIIRVNGERIDTMTEAQMMRVRDDVGMLFQENALFDSLTVAENVGYKDGLVYFEGDAEQLRASKDPYLKTYLSGWVPPLVS